MEYNRKEIDVDGWQSVVLSRGMFWGRRRCATAGGSSQLSSRIFTQYFPDGDRILAIMGSAGRAGGIKERDYSGCFFLVNVSVILFWFSSERKETIYFLSGRIKAKNLQWLYCQPRPCSNTGRWIINLSLFCCEAWFTGVIPWQAKDEHCWLCVPSIHY